MIFNDFTNRGNFASFLSSVLEDAAFPLKRILMNPHIPRLLLAWFATGLTAGAFLVPLHAQSAPDPTPFTAPTTPAPKPKDSDIANPANPAQPGVDKRVLGVLPNYRTADGTVPFQTISTKAKFTIATKDSFDYPVLGTTSFFAGLSQIRGDDNKIYGQGVEGFAHRLGISYADQVVGNYFPEAIIPTVFHMDPRYFRKSEGSIAGRTWYAVSRIFVCRTDSGKWAFCAPELVGNSAAALVSRAYHPHERTLGDTAEQFGSFTETDLVGDILKEFWPDIKRKLSHKHSNPGVVAGE
jgi:hypothetical protein